MTEELAELIQAINKWRETPHDEVKRYNLVQEIADVEVMLFQLEEIAKIEDCDIELVKLMKIELLNDRMKEEAGGKEK